VKSWGFLGKNWPVLQPPTSSGFFPRLKCPEKRWAYKRKTHQNLLI